MTAPTPEHLKLALDLALRLLQKHETTPVSDEFVALACVYTGDVSGRVMTVIEEALAPCPYCTEGTPDGNCETCMNTGMNRPELYRR